MFLYKNLRLIEYLVGTKLGTLMYEKWLFRRGLNRRTTYAVTNEPRYFPTDIMIHSAQNILLDFTVSAAWVSNHMITFEKVRFLNR